MCVQALLADEEWRQKKKNMIERHQFHQTLAMARHVGY
jgi:hypothetical protein